MNFDRRHKVLHQNVLGGFDLLATQLVHTLAPPGKQKIHSGKAAIDILKRLVIQSSYPRLFSRGGTELSLFFFGGSSGLNQTRNCHFRHGFKINPQFKLSCYSNWLPL